MGKNDRTRSNRVQRTNRTKSYNLRNVQVYKMKTTTNTAEQYAEIIAGELYDLDHAANGTPYGYDPDDSTTDDEIAAEYRQALTNLEMAHDTENPLDTWLNETALDLAVLVDTRGAEFGARIEILRTCGGPTCYIVRDTHDTERIEIRVSDGYQTHNKPVWLANVANYLDELTNQ